MKQPFGQKLTAGMKWSWSVALDDYSAADYSLAYYFRGAKTLDVAGVADGTGWTVEAAAVDTAKLTAGMYSWSLVVTSLSDATEKYELARGEVEIVADLSTAAEGYDGRSWVKKMLDAIRANLLGTASRVEQEYSVQGRLLRLASRKELEELEREFAQRYRDELEASGQSSRSSGFAKARFV